MLKNLKLIILISETHTFRHFHLIVLDNNNNNNNNSNSNNIFCREIYCALGDLWSTRICNVRLPRSSVSPKPGDLLVLQTWLYYSRRRRHVVLAMWYPRHVGIACTEGIPVDVLKNYGDKKVSTICLTKVRGTHIYSFSDTTKKVEQQSANFTELSGGLYDCGRIPSQKSLYSILKLCCTNHS